MPYTHELDATAGQLTVVGSGRSDFRETEAAIRWPADQPAFESRFAVLADLRELDYVPSFEEARGFAEVFKSQRLLLQGPVAVVVEGVVEIGIARLIAMLARFNGVRMQAFHDPARALQWLREAAGYREIS